MYACMQTVQDIRTYLLLVGREIHQGQSVVTEWQDRAVCNMQYTHI
jgi:hypothetical protein